jgi:hypothetical protein
MADTEPFLDDTLYAELLLQLRADRVRKREFIASITEGVILAVEQVQDVRLAALEQPPESSAADLVADAFWGFLFDSGINILWSRVVVGKFLLALEKASMGLRSYDMHLAKSTRKRVKDLTELRQTLYQKHPRDDSPPDVARLTAFIEKLDATNFDSAKAFRDGTTDIRSLIDDAVKNRQEFTQSRTGLFGIPLALRDLRVRFDRESKHAAEAAVAVEQLMNNTRAYLTQAPAEDIGTGSANLLAATYDWASRQRQQSELLCDQLEVSLMQSKYLQSPAGACLVLALTSDAVSMDLGEVRARAWLISEAVVWGELFSANLCGETSAAPENDVLESIGISRKISVYLRKRFRRDARNWIASAAASNILTPRNSTPNSKVRQWASKRLVDARTILKQEGGLRIGVLGMVGAPEERAAKVDSFAVAAFLLAMLNCYRDNASALMTQLSELKEELK